MSVVSMSSVGMGGISMESSDAGTLTLGPLQGMNIPSHGVSVHWVLHLQFPKR